ncbi:hypothetical protein FDJ57_gp38 [Gordonia phage Sour]|uniref:Uncharacterized protein n=1 Tax=Gordonia phage Sour TaxID=2182349 RepID=A0A2U8UKK5_9CAUD|nr:hypothetical protein FDJ57_gp38 [Gordonia phage Sour]AWN04239.1 hypothetical protein PBI_SOUR_38 [Gordonia phage Sour]
MITLAAITATHWRTLRGRLISYGVTRPLEDLGSLHALLDTTEAAVMESFSGKDAERERKNFIDKLYAPEPQKTLAGTGHKPAPAGFDEDAMEAAFDAFAVSAR